MSDFYHRFRAEVAAGGSVDEAVSPMATRNGKLTGIIMIGLLTYLAIKNPWTFVFVAGLLISVFLHEVGHFSTARLTGMKVTQFFMGFGPRVWSRTKGEVEYGVRALPLGAFVRIIGMNNVDEVDPADESRAYRSQTFPRRLLVITAGSLMHMLIAFVLFFGVYTSGGRQQNTGISTVRGLADSTSPASSAGIVVGDTLVSIGGISVTDYNSVSAAIRTFSAGETISVVFEHEGARQTREVVLVKHPSIPDRAYLGVMADDWGWKDLGVFESVGQSVSDIGSTITDSVKGVVVALNPMNSIRHLTKSPEATLETRPTTVVGVSEFSGTVGRSDGLKGVLVLLASINVFVGVFNMFPLLPFDGGHAAIAIYERVRSRKGRLYKADINKMVPLATLVVGLLSLLLLTGLYLDITQPLG
jgi:membrane-associated protease RseP (regulator of RpoE activity)